MPFAANSFVDGPAGGTPITAATLNNLEQGVVAADITTPGSAAALALDGLVAGYAGTSSATRTALIARGSVVNVKDFGAVGNKVTDDTAAIQAAINYAQTLVRDAASPTFNKQQDGATVFLPKGLYLISSTLTISESNIQLSGESRSSSVLLAPNANFNMVVFDNASYALYNCGVRDLKFSTPGNATAGYQLIVKHCIYFVAEDLLFNGWFGGYYLAGSGKVMNARLIFSQETRTNTTTTTGAAIYVATDYGYPSDVHWTDIQIMEDVAYAGLSSLVIMGCDGMYFENMHIHGSLFVNPSGTGNDIVLDSLWFTNCYFDGSRDACVNLSGNPTSDYKDVRFTSCYFRGGLTGLRVSTTATLRMLNVNGCHFAQNTQTGMEINNQNVNGAIIHGSIFDGNNTGNSVSYGDLKIGGNNIFVSDCIFSAGGAAGYGILSSDPSTNVTLSNINLINSATSTNRLYGFVAAVAYKGIRGYSLKESAVVAIAGAVTTAVISHGVRALLPTADKIRLTPAGSCPAYWVSAITSTTFTITFASATTAFNMGYMIDMEY